MILSTDKQTLDDLNIFGKQGTDSIFQLFNSCSTRGGSVLLEDMFRYPLCDAESINRRVKIMKYLARVQPAFPFQSADLDAAEQYLANVDERTKLSADDISLTRKIGNFIAQDTEKSVIVKGIISLVELFHHLHNYFNAPDTTLACELVKESEEINYNLSTYFSIVEETGKGKLSNQTLVAYDVLFRFRNRDAVMKCLRFIYLLDVYHTVSRVLVQRGFCFPRALPGAHLSLNIVSFFHPQVMHPIPNSMSVSREKNVLFLTGANMAGKSTFMKSLSIVMYLAHMGFPVPATQMEFTVMDGIYTTINLPDNLGIGASHFYAEVLRVKKMAIELGQGKNLFIVFDELFRGTNVKDAYEATIAITEAFARKKNSLFLISTHVIEAGEILKERCPGVRFVFLPTRIHLNHPVYTYTLEEGITNDRHGMIIINNEGILDMLEAGLHKNQSA